MRCLGRLVLLALILVAAAGAWWYHDDLHRWVDRTLHPATTAPVVGRSSPGALSTATGKLATLQRAHRDSVVLSPDEAAAILTQGMHFLPGASADSASVQLGDREVTIRTVVDSMMIPARWRELIPAHRARYRDVAATGSLVPVHAGLAEFDLRSVAVQGVPLPGGVIARLVTDLSGSRGRLEVVLPEVVGGFRVRPGGITVYRQGAMP